jgi:hypothetical protein
LGERWENVGVVARVRGSVRKHCTRGEVVARVRGSVRKHCTRGELCAQTLQQRWGRCTRGAHVPCCHSLSATRIAFLLWLTVALQQFAFLTNKNFSRYSYRFK